MTARYRFGGTAGASGVARGVGAATLVAGPVFLLVLTGSGEPMFAHGIPSEILIGLAFTIPFGAVLAVVPLMLGAALMTWLSNRLFVARFAPLWAIAGGTLAGLPVALLAPSGDAAPAWAVMGICGALCALVVRAFVRWQD